MYRFALRLLRSDTFDALIAEALDVSANGREDDPDLAMVRDGSRRRTPGGVFFVLARRRAGKPWRWRDFVALPAKKAHDERMVRKLVATLLLCRPATEEDAPPPRPVIAAPVAPVAPRLPVKHRRDRASVAVPEVLVVRRR